MDKQKIEQLLLIIFATASVAIVVILSFALVGLVKEKNKYSQINEQLARLEADSTAIAKKWVEENASTYRYDGSKLKPKDFVICDDELALCQQVSFSYESAHGGYGDRSITSTAQVVTLHTIVVTLQRGVVTSAISDEKFDEINQRLVQTH